MYSIPLPPTLWEKICWYADIIKDGIFYLIALFAWWYFWICMIWVKKYGEIPTFSQILNAFLSYFQ